MKKRLFLLFICCFLSTNTATAAFTLYLKITNKPENFVSFRLPISSVYVRDNRLSDTLNAQGEYILKLPIDQPCFLEILQKKIYAEPNSELYMDYDYEKNQVTYTGSLQNENYITRRFKYDMNNINTVVNDFAKNNTSPSLLYKDVMAARDIELSNFETVCATNTVSPYFVKTMRWEILYAYADVFNRLYGLNTNLRRNSETPSSSPEWEILLKKNLSELAFSNDEAISSESYFNFANFYFSHYRKPFTNVADKWTCAEMNNIPNLLKKDFKGKTYDMLFADIFGRLAYENYICILPQIELYASENPNSAFTPFLKDKSKHLKSLIDAEKKILTADMHIIDNTQMDTIAQLFDKFRGQVVFVDIWATWCGPCKAEFSHKTDLEVFAQQNNITMLYISVDKSDKDALWKTMIKRYDLNGYNIRLTDILYKQLYQLLQGSTGIPRYFILDKTGKIVVYDAKHPSEKGELFKQLKTYLD